MSHWISRVLLLMLVAGASVARADNIDFSELKAALIHAVEVGYIDPTRAGAVREKLDALTVSPANPDQASAMLTNALRDATGDFHFSVRHDPTWFERVTGVDEMLAQGLPEEQPESTAEEAAQQRQENYYFRQASILSGNIGYLRLDRMPDIRLAGDTLAAAMAWLAHSDAVILDLRFNPGGIGGFTPALASYFMPEPDAELFYRRTRSERRVYTTDRHAGGVWSAKPLYILISDTTGSAAENLAYTLQQHGRATLVGENSGRGGGHSATMVRLVDGFVLALPFAEVVNSASGEGWHLRGVEPDLATAPEAALGEAHLLALTNLLSGAGPEDQARWRTALQLVQAESQQRAAPACDEDPLQPFTGTFGIREVRIRECRLALRRDGGPWLILEPIAGSQRRFQMTLPTGAVAARPLPEVGFALEAGIAAELQFLHPDGSVERNARSGD